MKAQVLRLGPPADAHGTIFPPGCLKPATVPITLDFNGSAVIGYAEVAEDGSAVLRLKNVAGTIGEVGLGFRPIRWHAEQGSVVFDEIEPICVSAEVKK